MLDYPVLSLLFFSAFVTCNCFFCIEMKTFFKNAAIFDDYFISLQ